MRPRLCFLPIKTLPSISDLLTIAAVRQQRRELPLQTHTGHIRIRCNSFGQKGTSFKLLPVP